MDSSSPEQWRPGDNDDPKPTNAITTWSAEDLRGVPIIGPGSPGTSPGTDPLAAYIHKERAA